MDPAGPATSSNKSSASAQSIAPPYWQQHRQHESYSSVGHLKPQPIILEDHTEERSEQSGALWAKGVSVTDHVLVSGTVPNLGDFMVWNCTIEMLNVGSLIPRPASPKSLLLSQ